MEYTACGHIGGTTGPVPWVSAAPSVKSSLIGQWIFGLWPYCWHFGNLSLLRCEPSLNINVIGQWIIRICQNCWQFGCCPMSACTTVPQPSCECAIVLRHLGVLLSLRIQAPEWYWKIDFWIEIKIGSPEVPKRLQCKKRNRGGTGKIKMIK